MQELLLTLQEPWAFRALMASVMVGLMCGLLGPFIVLRNMSLIGDGLAHSILPGVYVAFLVFGITQLGIFFGAVIAGLVTVLIITWIQNNVPTKNDAAIGIAYTFMFALGIIGISSLTASEGVHIDTEDFLLGKVLGVSNSDLLLNLFNLILIAISVVLGFRHLFLTTFQPSIASVMGVNVNLIHYFLMLLVSFAVVSSLRTVGVILVVAMLITPAASALLISNDLKKVVALSSLLGMMCSAIGLTLSIILIPHPVR